MVPTVLLLAALVLAPVIGGGFGSLTNGILQILVFGGAATHILFYGRNGESWFRVPGIYAVAVYSITVILSAFFSESIFLSVKHLLFAGACIVAYIISAAVSRDSKKASMLVVGMAISAMAICVMAIRDYAISTGGGSKFWAALTSPGDHWRIFGTFINPGFFAGFLVIALPITLGIYLVARRSALALLFGVAFVAETAALMLTGTKFGIFSAAIALMLFFALALATKSVKRPLLMRLLIVTIVLAPLLFVFVKPVKTRIQSAEAGGTQVHSTMFRLYTWRATVDMIKHNPWVGVGPGAYAVAYPRYTIAGPTSYAHQSYLQIAAESGVVSLLALLASLGAILCSSFFGILRNREVDCVRLQADENEAISLSDAIPPTVWRMLNCAIFAALIGSMIRSAVDSDWYVIGIALPFWIMAGILVSRTATNLPSFALKVWPRTVTLAVCAMGILLSLSFGQGDWYGPENMRFETNLTPDQIQKRLELAVSVSPLDYAAHRELSKYLAANGSYDDSIKQADIAIAIAPTDAANHYGKGIICTHFGKTKDAISSFRRSLVFNPHNTQAFYQLALAYQSLGDTKAYESTLKRMLAVEKTPYERITGVPEMVDTRYSYAHAYFADKYLAEKKYAQAAEHYEAVAERLERWKSRPQYIEIALMTGKLTKAEENQLVERLREGYLGLAQCYAGMGDRAAATEATAKAAGVKAPH